MTVVPSGTPLLSPSLPTLLPPTIDLSSEWDRKTAITRDYANSYGKWQQKQSLIIHTHTHSNTFEYTHTLAHTHIFMAAPKHATFIYSTFCQTRAQIIYESPQNEWAAPAPEYPTIAPPLPYPASLYIAYIPRHICRIVCVHGLEYGHSTCLAPGLRPGHSLTLPSLTPTLPSPSLLPP